MLPQALLVGRPVISYDIDGAREVVLPETGILLEAARSRRAAPGDPAPGRRTRTRGPRWDAKADARFADQFRHETMTRQLRSLYERLLEPQADPARVRV